MIDKYAIFFFVGFIVIGLIFASPRSYVSFVNPEKPERSFDAIPPEAATLSVEDRVAANALIEAGFIAVDPKLSTQGKLQFHDIESELGSCIGNGVNVLSGHDRDVVIRVAESIVAIEEFNRTLLMRTMKDWFAWLYFKISGRVIPVSLGVGQVRVKRFRSLLQSGWILSDVSMPVEPGGQLLFLLDPCKNVSAVGGIVQQDFTKLSEEKRSPDTLGRVYNGGLKEAGIFEYGNMVFRAYFVSGGEL